MMTSLPYRATTQTGDVFDLRFPLHPDTGSAVRVDQLLSLILDAVDRDIAAMGETSNGDVLQALAMATAVRARMIHAPSEQTARLAASLVDGALSAASEAERQAPQSGTA